MFNIYVNMYIYVYVCVCVCLYIYIHKKDNKMIRSRQHGFTKQKSGMTDLIALYMEMTCSMDEERAYDVFYFRFTKTFDTLSHNILIDKLMKHGLDK